MVVRVGCGSDGGKLQRERQQHGIRTGLQTMNGGGWDAEGVDEGV